MTDYISRADAIEAVRGLSVLVDDEDFSYFENALKALPSADRPTHDCTNLVQWLLEETMDEESWRENADAIGEIICRKLKKLGVLDTKDGYYIRTPLAYDDRPSGEWEYDVDADDSFCTNCHKYAIRDMEMQLESDFCPNCGARMKGGDDE